MRTGTMEDMSLSLLCVLRNEGTVHSPLILHLHSITPVTLRRARNLFPRSRARSHPMTSARLVNPQGNRHNDDDD